MITLTREELKMLNSDEVAALRKAVKLAKTVDGGKEQLEGYIAVLKKRIAQRYGVLDAINCKAQKAFQRQDEQRSVRNSRNVEDINAGRTVTLLNNVLRMQSA